MKKSSFLLGGALLLAALFTTSCKEMMGSLDNPVSAYLETDTTTMVLVPGQDSVRVATTISDAKVVYESSDDCYCRPIDR